MCLALWSRCLRWWHTASRVGIGNERAVVVGVVLRVNRRRVEWEGPDVESCPVEGGDVVAGVDGERQEHASAELAPSMSQKYGLTSARPKPVMTGSPGVDRSGGGGR